MSESNIQNTLVPKPCNHEWETISFTFSSLYFSPRKETTGEYQVQQCKQCGRMEIVELSDE